MDSLLKILPFVIKFFPTFLFVLIILFQMLMGYIRGKRKSFIYFIKMLISMVVATIVFLIISPNMLMSFMGLIAPDLGFDGSTTEDFIFLMLSLNGYESYAIAEIVAVYFELLFDLVAFLLILGAVYAFTNGVLNIVYLFVFRKKVKELNKEKGKQKVWGMLIGAGRGVILGFLVFSQLAAVYSILAGDVFYNKSEYQSIEIDGEIWEYDEIYEALKTSRSFGISALFDLMAGDDGTPLDYLYVDAFVRAKYESGDVTLVLREEIANTIGIAANLFDKGVLYYANGTINVDLSKFDENVVNGVCDSLAGVNTITDVIPVVMLELLAENGIVVDEKYYKDLNVKNDINQVANILCAALNFLTFDENNKLDIDYMGLDAEIVDDIIDSISHITFLTKVALPLGVDYAAHILEDIVFDFDSIIWNEEIQNLKGLYSLMQKLDIKVGNLSNTSYYVELLEDEEKSETINKVIKQIFNSDLVCEISKVVVQYTVNNYLADFGIFDGIDIDMSSYSKEDVYNDVVIITDNISSTISVYKTFTGGLSNMFSMDVTPVRELVIGNLETEGLLDLKMFELMGVDKVISNMCRSFISEDMPEITNSKIELGYFFDGIEAFQAADVDISSLMSGDYSSLRNNPQEENIINAVDNSVILSYGLGSNLNTILGGTLTIPENVKWYEDKEAGALLKSVFHLLNADENGDLLSGNFSNLLTTLEQDDIKTLLDSVVFHGTISNYLLDFSSADDSDIVVPSDAIGIDGYIQKNEILKLTEFAFNNNLTDFSNFNVNDLEIFSDDIISSIDNSMILSRTVVKKLIDNETIEIPGALNNVENENWYSDKGNDELNTLLVALQSVFGSDAKIDELEIELNNFIKNSDDVLKSSVLAFTISNNVEGVDALIIPSSVYSTDDYYGANGIEKEELKGLFDALNILNGDGDDFDLNDFNVNNVFGNPDKLEQALKESLIFHYTVSQNVIKGNEGLEFIVVDNTNDKTVIEINDDYDILTIDEIVALIRGMNVLSNDNDLGSVSVSFDSFKALTVENRSTILNSAILKTLISKSITTGDPSILDGYNAINNDNEIETIDCDIYNSERTIGILSVEDIEKIIEYLNKIQ